MARSPDERVKQAHKLYLKGFKLVDIERQLNLSDGTARRWKLTYKWVRERVGNEKGKVGNKNAIGNIGGSAPKKNNNAVRHGLYEKYLPKETLDIVNNMSLNPLDVMWSQIQIAHAAIIRAQAINYVKDRDDVTKRLITEDDNNAMYSYQEAWDKQNNFLKAQARAQSELRSMVKQYDELLHSNRDLATEEQKLRIESMRANIKAQKGEKQTDSINEFIKATKPSKEDIEALYDGEVIDDDIT